MKRLTLSLLGSVLGILLAAGPTPAQQVLWSYNWEPSVLSLAADAPGSKGSVTFTDEPTENASGSTDVVATNIRTFSTATTQNPDHFINASYGLSITLTDNDTHKSGTLRFSGALHGLFSAVYSNVRNVFNSPITQSLNLGGDVFTVTMGPYAPPGVPTSHNAGSIAAHVQVTPAPPGGTSAPPPGNGGGNGSGNGGGNGQQLSPEPSTLALSCLGLSYFGFASWRRRNRKA